MTKYPLNEIPSGYFFTKPVYLDDGFILTAPEVPFSEDLKQILLQWSVNEVSSGGEAREEYSGGETADGSAGESFAPGAKTVEADAYYRKLLAYVESLVSMVRTNRELRFGLVSEWVKEICNLPKEKHRFLLRVLQGETSREENYLASHALKSAILSITIGQFIKLPLHRLIELGVAALLHEAGMFKLSPQIYMAQRELTPPEREAIRVHPALGYNMLKRFAFPLPVCVAVLEHHERENGSGYPSQIKGDKISLYAKIIAVTCSYESLTSIRPHKDAKDAYTGMVELLKNAGKQYDDIVIRALLFSLSLYPIGLYVLLSNEKKGQVVDVNLENPRYPMVQIFGEIGLDGKNKIIETSQDGVFIVRPLEREEVRTGPV